MPAETHPCDCDFYAGGVHATEGRWARWRYHTRRTDRYGYWLPWSYGWMCVRCQRSTPRDGDGKPLTVDVRSLKRKPAARLLRGTHAD